ncbi:hypothetical protein NP493_380g02025 [Ridgeia piscesae]|uniref:Chitin-binding type-2 domain-containing protein n=1 Tax=Ridgeia piscesae TaxID=27915 RepID=A0AAD9L1W1_RIDPI|nr:hypothetical protein NP493_380g02025 [Ridgeia piscesae]
MVVVFHCCPRYYDSRRQERRHYEDDNAGVSDRWGQVDRKDTNNRWDSRKNEAPSMTSHPAQSSDFRHKEYRSDDRTAAMTSRRSTRQGFRCSYPGLYADPSSCAAYFICVRHGGRWFNFRLRCPSGFAYKSSTSGCGRDVSCIH